MKGDHSEKTGFRPSPETNKKKNIIDLTRRGNFNVAAWGSIIPVLARARYWDWQPKSRPHNVKISLDSLFQRFGRKASLYRYPSITPVKQGGCSTSLCGDQGQSTRPPFPQPDLLSPAPPLASEEIKELNYWVNGFCLINWLRVHDLPPLSFGNSNGSDDASPLQWGARYWHESYPWASLSVEAGLGISGWRPGCYSLRMPCSIVVAKFCSIAYIMLGGW